MILVGGLVTLGAIVWVTNSPSDPLLDTRHDDRPQRVRLEATFSNDGHGLVTASRVGVDGAVKTIASRDVSNSWAHDEVVQRGPVKFTIVAAADADNQRRGTITCIIRVDGQQRDKQTIPIRPGGISAVNCSHTVK